MQISSRSAAAVAAVIVAAGCAATLAAQASDAGAGSLGELTVEIRHLRLAIEQSARTQTQAQALGIMLSAQQSRIVQVSARLEGERRELDNLSQQSANLASRLAAIDESLPRVTDPQQRAAIEEQNSAMKLELKRVAGLKQLARTRELEASQAWQQEETRWNDLMWRLQEIAQR